MAISIHALLAESDRGGRPPAPDNQHFNPRSPCGERRQQGRRQRRGDRVSIHALLAECDLYASAGKEARRTISIHALLAESDALTTGAAYDII